MLRGRRRGGPLQLGVHSGYEHSLVRATQPKGQSTRDGTTVAGVLVGWNPTLPGGHTSANATQGKAPEARMKLSGSAEATVFQLPQYVDAPWRRLVTSRGGLGRIGTGLE